MRYLCPLSSPTLLDLTLSCSEAGNSTPLLRPPQPPPPPPSPPLTPDLTANDTELQGKEGREGLRHRSLALIVADGRNPGHPDLSSALMVVCVYVCVCVCDRKRAAFSSYWLFVFYFPFLRSPHQMSLASLCQLPSLPPHLADDDNNHHNKQRTTGRTLGAPFNSSLPLLSAAKLVRSYELAGFPESQQGLQSHLTL